MRIATCYLSLCVWIISRSIFFRSIHYLKIDYKQLVLQIYNLLYLYIYSIPIYEYTHKIYMRVCVCVCIIFNYFYTEKYRPEEYSVDCYLNDGKTQITLGNYLIKYHFIRKKYTQFNVLCRALYQKSIGKSPLK